MWQHEIKANGWTYHVRIDSSGKIIAVICEYRNEGRTMNGYEWAIWRAMRDLEPVVKPQPHKWLPDCSERSAMFWAGMATLATLALLTVVLG